MGREIGEDGLQGGGQRGRVEGRNHPSIASLPDEAPGAALFGDDGGAAGQERFPHDGAIGFQVARKDHDIGRLITGQHVPSVQRAGKMDILSGFLPALL